MTSTSDGADPPRGDAGAGAAEDGGAARRCFGDGDALLGAYHDREWGRPVIDEHGLYERICLEAFQAGLSWNIVLRKREALRRAFAGFEVERVAAFDEADAARVLAAPGIIHNRAKVAAAVHNARSVLALRRSGGSLVDLVWSFRPASAAGPAGRTLAEMPARTPESAALASDLKRCGFRFIGPTTAYALMQAAGLVNDHLPGCPVRAEVAREQAGAVLRLRGAGGLG